MTRCRNLQCSANCSATKLRLVKQANSLPLTPRYPPPPTATVAPVLVQHFQYSFLLGTTLTLAQAKRSRRRNEELLLPAAAPCCGCCCSAVACSSAPMRWPVPSRVPQSLPLLLPRALATACPLFVFVNFDLFAAYFAL